jgi:hypothetical protein
MKRQAPHITSRTEKNFLSADEKVSVISLCEKGRGERKEREEEKVMSEYNEEK